MKFEPSDFDSVPIGQAQRDVAAYYANAKLESIKAEYELANQKLLDQLIELKAKIDLAPVVWADRHRCQMKACGHLHANWRDCRASLTVPTHRARLVDIEELK